MIEIYKKILEQYEQHCNAVVCTVVSTKGSTPLKAGAKMIVSSEETFGTVGGGKLEMETIVKARKLLGSTANQIENISLVTKEGTSCGGQVEIFFEPLAANYPLHIFGAGHVGRALAEIARDIGFDITIIDDRQGIFDTWTDKSLRLVNSGFVEFLESIRFDVNTFIVIITYDHKADWEIISFCVSNPWHYLGMMGSKSKVATFRKRLIESGVKEEIIDRVDMPIGISIEAESAKEIAISIAAKLIMEKSKLIAQHKVVTT